VAAERGPVEFAHQRHVFVDLGDRLELGLQLAHVRVVGLGKVGDALGEQHRLEHLADLVRQLHVAERQAGDAGAGVGAQRDQAARLQNAQRVAHRNAAEAELAGQLVLLDAGAGLQLPRHDALGDDIGHTLAGDGGLFEPLHLRSAERKSDPSAIAAD
jgi:hypothetical protein